MIQRGYTPHTQQAGEGRGWVGEREREIGVYSHLPPFCLNLKAGTALNGSKNIKACSDAQRVMMI
jgi:hypothetical protein